MDSGRLPSPCLCQSSKFFRWIFNDSLIYSYFIRFVRRVITIDYLWPFACSLTIESFLPLYLHSFLPYHLRDTQPFNFSPTTAWNIGSGVRTEFKSTLFEYTNMYLSVIFRIAERSTWRGMVVGSFLIEFKTYQFSLVLVKQVLLMPYSDS